MKNIQKLTIITALLISILVTSAPFATAAVMDDSFVKGQCVSAVIQSIVPSSVEIDQEFSVGVNLESCGDKVPENVKLSIIDMPPDIIVNENLITLVPKLYYSTSERFITYHMRTTPDANPGVHTIKLQLEYGDGQNNRKTSYDITFNVQGEDAEPRIESVTTEPVHIYEGDSVDLTLGIKNFGESVAKSTKIRLNHQFKGVKEVTLGALDISESQNVIFRFKASAVGEFNIPVIIDYEDDFGIQSKTYDVKITILDEKGSLNIASVKIEPTLPMAGEQVELTMRIENYGERTINSIRVYTDHPFLGVKESFIGTLEPNEDGPAVVTFIPDVAGEYTFPVTITYQDDFGQEIIQTNVNVIVMEANGSAGSTFAVIIVAVIIGGLVYLNIRTRKSKDQIIKQLMNSSQPSKKK